MKRIILLTILALMYLAPSIVKAQAVDVIPNGKFDTWAPGKKGKDSLVGWSILAGSADSVSSCDYTKGVDLISRPDYDAKHCVSLACTLNGTTPVVAAIRCKFAMTKHDSCLVANFAYIQGGSSPNSPLIYLVAFKHSATPQTSDTCLKAIIGFNAFADTIEPWNTLSASLKYINSTMPDSAFIIVQNELWSPVDPGTVLFVENLYFSNLPVTTGIHLSPNLSNSKVTAYPNPFTQTTSLHYTLGLSTNVNLSVFDMQGREVSNLVNSHQPAGAHDVTFDGGDLKNGIYFYRLQTGTGVETGKLILNK